MENSCRKSARPGSSGTFFRRWRSLRRWSSRPGSSPGRWHRGSFPRSVSVSWRCSRSPRRFSFTSRPGNWFWVCCEKSASMPESRLKVSVCVVAYNHGRYIGDCLASVVGQQVEADLEILVGDDCSTDETREIIAAYAARYPGLVHPVFHPRNIGGTRNYQVLIGKAEGDYIAHLDEIG